MNKRLLWWILPLVWMGGCYSFQDASFDPRLESCSVEYFNDNASGTNPALPQLITEALKTKIISESNLRVIQTQADIAFSGAITRYEVTYLTPSADETAAENQLTIALSVSCINNIDPDKSWEQTFSRFATFDSNVNFINVEDQLVNEIISQLVDDIFRRAFINW